MALTEADVLEILQSKSDFDKLKQNDEEREKDEEKKKNKPTLNCPECGLKFSSSSLMSYHVLEHHPGFLEEFDDILEMVN